MKINWIIVFTIILTLLLLNDIEAKKSKKGRSEKKGKRSKSGKETKSSKKGKSKKNGNVDVVVPPTPVPPPADWTPPNVNNVVTKQLKDLLAQFQPKSNPSSKGKQANQPQQPSVKNEKVTPPKAAATLAPKKESKQKEGAKKANINKDTKTKGKEKTDKKSKKSKEPRETESKNSKSSENNKKNSKNIRNDDQLNPEKNTKKPKGEKNKENKNQKPKGRMRNVVFRQRSDSNVTIEEREKRVKEQGLVGQPNFYPLEAFPNRCGNGLLYREEVCYEASASNDSATWEEAQFSGRVNWGCLLTFGKGSSMTALNMFVNHVERSNQSSPGEEFWVGCRSWSQDDQVQFVTGEKVSTQTIALLFQNGSVETDREPGSDCCAYNITSKEVYLKNCSEQLRYYTEIFMLNDSHAAEYLRKDRKQRQMEQDVLRKNTMSKLESLNKDKGLFQFDISLTPAQQSAVDQNASPASTREQLYTTPTQDVKVETLLDNVKVLTKRNAVTQQAWLWPKDADGNVEVCYQFDAAKIPEANQQKVNAAVAVLASKTGIKFVEKKCANYIQISDTGGCSSQIGFYGGQQPMSLAEGCINSPGIIQHEFMHALGFWHEQARNDRDNFVKIITKNIQAGTEKQFEKLAANYVNNQGFAYDYASLMHYASNAFAKDPGLTTIETLQPNVQIGQRDGPTPNDIAEITKLYGITSAINGAYGPWGKWSTCTATCGGGTQARTRVCDEPAPSNGGADCQGSASETRACGSEACPSASALTELGCWSDNGVPDLLTSVDSMIGGNYNTRTDQINKCAELAKKNNWSIFALKFGGKCYAVTGGENYKEKGPASNCIDGRGSGSAISVYATGQVPVDGDFGEWGYFSYCTKTCGSGLRTRTRACDNPKPKNGGKECDPSQATESQSCATTPCPVNGGFGPFGPWSNCLATCGSTIRWRGRQCNNPPPQFGGADCDRSKQYETEKCTNLPACPVQATTVQAAATQAPDQATTTTEQPTTTQKPTTTTTPEPTTTTKGILEVGKLVTPKSDNRLFNLNVIYTPKRKMKSLGMINGVIEDHVLSSSGTEPGCHVTHARPYSGSAWRAANSQSWIQVDLGKPTRVVGLGTLGDYKRPAWVKTFRVLVGNHPSSLRALMSPSNSDVFSGNSDQNTWKHHLLKTAVNVQFVRIEPQTYEGAAPALRFDLYGRADKKTISYQNALSRDVWTRNTTGCGCYFDRDDTSCACCEPGGAQCPRSSKQQCVQAGYASFCGQPEVALYSDEIDGWTKSLTGCACANNSSDLSCACCQRASCQCASPNQHQCAQCGQQMNQCGAKPHVFNRNL